MKTRIILSSVSLLTLLCFVGCETWPIAAARAAKKREGQTGPLMGELEQAAGVEDPLGREQGSVDQTADNMGNKVEGVGSRVEDVAEDF